MNNLDEVRACADIIAATLNAISEHCMSTDCNDCRFLNNFGVCILEQKPRYYDINRIKRIVLEQLVDELKQTAECGPSLIPIEDGDYK